MILEDENIDLFVPPLEGITETTDDTLKDEKKTRKHGLLNWLKLRVRPIWFVRILWSIPKVDIRNLYNAAYQITTRTANMEFCLGFISFLRQQFYSV